MDNSEAVPNINLLENLSAKDKKALAGVADRLVFYLLSVVLVATPLLFIPVLSDSFDFPKQTVLLVATLLGLLVVAVKGLVAKKTVLPRSVFGLPILLLVATAVASSLLSDNRMAALSADTVLLAGGAGLFFLITSLKREGNYLLTLLKLLLFSGAGVAVLAVLQMGYTLLAAVLKLNLNLVYLSPAFSLTGSPLSSVMFLLALLPIGVGILLASRKEAGVDWTLAVLLGAISLGLAANLYVLYQNRPILLPQNAGWKIATGVMGESPVKALLGAGPGHFVDAFTAYKPLDFNGGPFWNLRFSTSSNYYFYLLSTLGIVGLSAFLWLTGRLVMVARQRWQVSGVGYLEKGLLASLGLILVLLLFLPGPTIVIFLLFALLGILTAYYSGIGVSLYATDKELPQGSWLPYGLAGVLVLIFAGAVFFLGKFTLADFYFSQSLLAASANRGSDTYNFQIRALGLNPDNSTYRVSYSQTNLALANALAGTANLSDQQKQTVIALVQQSLREGRLAAASEPRRAANWENLALIYRNLMGFAQGADQWAIASENQAVNLDPTNPRLRLDLGGIFFALKDYQSAGQIFNQAVNLKPDYANGHYNLAQALKQLNLSDQAKQQLQLTATLVCTANRNSTDCQKVNSEIAQMTTTAGTGGTVAGTATEAAKVATPSAQITPAVQAPLATPGANTSNLPKAKVTPPPKIATSGGELTR